MQVEVASGTKLQFLKLTWTDIHHCVCTVQSIYFFCWHNNLMLLHIVIYLAGSNSRMA